MALTAHRRSLPVAHLYSHRSAATLHELPVWSDWMRGRHPGRALDPLVVHLVSRQLGSGSHSATVVSHRTVVPDHEQVSIAEYRCTSADRTLADLAATEPFGVALASADVLLRREVCANRVIDEAGVEAWRERIRDAARTRRGRPGAMALRIIAALARPEAESPLETVSRLRHLQLGLDPELQVAVAAEHGGYLYLDFVLRHTGFFGESDGKSKYADAGFRRGLTPDEVFERERRRHNWIAGSTGMTGVRWGVADVVTVERFAALLQKFHVPFPGQPVISYGPEVAAFLRSVT